MGLKYGFAKIASKEDLYIPMKIGSDRKTSFAKVFLWVETVGEAQSKMKAYLRFLDGSVGHLQKNFQGQLKVSSLQPAYWVCTKEQIELMRDGVPIPKEMLIFGGSHVVREVSHDEFLPPPQYDDDESRFINPVGLWNQVVAMYIKGPQVTS